MQPIGERGGARGGTRLPSRVNYTGQLARIPSSGLAVQITGCVRVFVCVCTYTCKYICAISGCLLYLSACVTFSLGFLFIYLYVCVCMGVNLCVMCLNVYTVCVSV